jgi:hypothetical protein
MGQREKEFADHALRTIEEKIGSIYGSIQSVQGYWRLWKNARFLNPFIIPYFWNRSKRGISKAMCPIDRGG